MDRLVVIVTFTLKPGARARFLPLVAENAAASVREEIDCIRFDVLTPPAGDEIVLYEIYSDADAFERHLATDHFGKFDASTRDLVLAKSSQRYSVLENAKGGP